MSTTEVGGITGSHPLIEAGHVDGACYDLVRAIVSALSWRDQRLLVPVSSLAIHHELQRRNRKIVVSEVLGQLSEVGDIQRVEGGYWLPSPTHLAVSHDFALVISGLPTQELRREVGLKPVDAGVSRIIEAEQAKLATISVRSLAEWIGAPSSTPQWTENLIRTAQYMVPHGLETADVFRHWRGQSRARWERLSDIAVPEDLVALARIKSIDHRTNYYLLQLRNSTPVAMHELPPGSDVLRLMCGLRRIGGDPLRCRIKPDKKAGVARLWVGVAPRAERRLLTALGEIAEDEKFRGLDASLPIAALPSVIAAFESLGCEIEQVRHD